MPVTAEVARLRGATRGQVSQRYEARLLDGPRDGMRVTVSCRPDGGPLDVPPVRGDRHGAYVLAGYPGPLGTLPYRWVTKEEWAALRRWLPFGDPTS